MTDKDFGGRIAFFRTHGKWTINDLPAGNFDVSVRTGQGTAERQGVELAAGATVTGLDLVIEGGAKISGRVVSLETGEPLAGFHVLALSQRDGFYDSSVHGGKGRATCRGPMVHFHSRFLRGG